MPDSSTSRQSFLGPRLGPALQLARLAIIGLSGGGSHVVQQLAHIGFQHYLIFDPDIIEDTNLTRLVGATADDVAKKRAKTEIAERVIRSVQPRATLQAFQTRWQDKAEYLKCADLIFSCVDSFLCRRDLEVLARRYRIPLIDIGMDVVPNGQGHRMYGQAALSLPGGPCFLCQKLLTEDLLAREGARYGSAGPQPQVVWANGVLASTAIGIALDLITGWSGPQSVHAFASFDGNTGSVSLDPRRRFCPPHCTHFLDSEAGDPKTILL